MTEVLAVGGGAGSALWNQIKADVVGQPWRVPSRQDGAMLADAALAGTAVGAFGDLAATVSSWVGEGAVSVARPGGARGVSPRARGARRPPRRAAARGVR